MSDIFDYLDWRGDLSFKADQFNSVDNVVFSILSYYPFEGIVGGGFENKHVPLPQALKKLDARVKKDPSIERGFLFGPRQIKFLRQIAYTPRYADCLLIGYENKIDIEREMQFAAITIVSPGIPAYTAFRGTDQAIIGWKEDLNMILSDTIPAQLAAAGYLNNAAKHLRGPINPGGHSKGGNLAVYAAAFCNKSVQKRVNTVYSNDAPGFNKAIISSAQYKNIEDRIECYIPEDSVVGLLFECAKNSKVVKSSESGILQHNPFSWEVKGKDMVHIDSVSKNSIFLNKTLMEWLENMDQQTRAYFVETLYRIVTEANIKSIPDFTDNTFKNTALLIKSLHNVDGKSKKMLLKMVSALFETAKNNIQAFMNIKKPLKNRAETGGYDTI
jgi:hypothetical protein